ncbi:hypothetical protein RN001_000756 [Aquatica leii]|uniref:rRNA biogenesis protein RRP36 n=1 Tax=Aquatica leii TaxID=1421715 RepID=A0AAN7PAH6_9COLE|nr:hypothetical protein RN001_000756 [Aquatica leii]
MDIEDNQGTFKMEENEFSERELIRKQISSMSFEDLQKLKEKIGSKEYNNVIFGANKNSKKQTTFKRENKNRPRERSSKIRFERANEVKKLTPRDPRFDPICGTYNEKIFKTNYKFISDIKKSERTQLQKEFKKEQDPQRKQQIQLLIQRIDNQNREYEIRDKKISKDEEEKRAIRKTLMQGQKPVYKKKSEKRMENLIEKYEDLKKSNKLQKHLEKRYKKLAHNDKKTLFKTQPT